MTTCICNAITAHCLALNVITYLLTIDIYIYIYGTVAFIRQENYLNGAFKELIRTNLFEFCVYLDIYYFRIYMNCVDPNKDFVYLI